MDLQTRELIARYTLATVLSAMRFVFELICCGSASEADARTRAAPVRRRLNRLLKERVDKSHGVFARDANDFLLAVSSDTDRDRLAADDDFARAVDAAVSDPLYLGWLDRRATAQWGDPRLALSREQIFERAMPRVAIESWETTTRDLHGRWDMVDGRPITRRN